ncbi:MAG: HAD family hydrolase [Candidatus Cryptobacteroides sp.]
MIQGIVFDMGGVLIDLYYERCVSAFKAIGFEQICDYLDPCHQKGIYGDMESGKVSADEFYEFVLTKCNPGTTRADIDACMKSFYDGPSKEKADYLISLKKRGYKIFMLSNNNPIMMRICDEDFSKVGIGINDFFDKAFISSTMKMLKPDSEIFLESIRQTGFKADELLFIDDSARNTEGARAVGMNAVDYVQGDSLEQTIENALAILP